MPQQRPSTTVQSKPSLDGVKAKIARALRHATEFEQVRKAWRASMKANPPMTLENGPSPGRPTVLLTAPRPDPALPLIIGDCVHNLRTSLDHLVGQLAFKEGHDVNARSTLAFPIFDKQADYSKMGRKNIERFIKDKAALDLIDAAQPYHRANPKGDPLWVLSNLDNIDKHRTLVIVAPRLTAKGMQETIGRAPDERPAGLSGDSDLMIFQLEMWPAAHATVDEAGDSARSFTIRADATLALATTGLACDGHPVRKSLALMIARVRKLVNGFERFFE